MLPLRQPPARLARSKSTKEHQTTLTVLRAQVLNNVPLQVLFSHQLKRARPVSTAQDLPKLHANPDSTALKVSKTNSNARLVSIRTNQAKLRANRAPLETTVNIQERRPTFQEPSIRPPVPRAISAHPKLEFSAKTPAQSDTMTMWVVCKLQLIVRCVQVPIIARNRV